MSRWLELARQLVEGRTFLVVGIGAGAALDLIGLGGRVVGAVSVLPASAPPGAPELPFPLLTLLGSRRDIFDHVVQDFGPTLNRASAEVKAFFSRCDPEGKAIVLSTFPAPNLGHGRLWAQDSGISRFLEEKGNGPALFDGLLPSPEGRAANWPMSSDSWARLQTELGDTLVVQDAGLSGGGNGTWIVAGWEEALAALGATQRAVRLATFVPGEPCNVSVIVADDSTVVFPPSRQLIFEDLPGRPVYGGNQLGGVFEKSDVVAIRSEVRAFCVRLRGIGFRGPLGLDFILRPDGVRCYHDINPRLNGVLDGLSRYLAVEGMRPLTALLHCPRPWTSAEGQALEDDLDAAVEDLQPGFLSRRVATDRVIVATPPAGTWEFLPAPSHKGPEVPIADLDSTTALLLPTLAPGLQLRAGERLFLGDLVCTPSLGRDLTAHWGASLARELVDAFLD